MKKIITFILITLPWFFSSLLIKNNPNFYQSLNLPSFAPMPIIFKIIWPVLYLLISYSIFLIIKEFRRRDLKDYYLYLIINYISNQLFSFFFFKLQNIFLSFVDSIVILLSSLFLYYEAKSLNNNSSKFLIPYIIWSLFASVLTLIIYFMNF